MKASRISQWLRAHRDIKADPFSCILLVLPILLYIKALNYPFTNWDDPYLITYNALIKSLRIPHLLSLFSSNFHLTLPPITILSYALDYKMWGLNPFGYHLTNLAIFCIVVLLVYKVFQGLTGSVTAFFASLLFASHPLCVEPVVWISGRKDLLCLLFVLSAVQTSYHEMDIPKCYEPRINLEMESPGEAKGSIKWTVITTIFYLLAMLSKPVAVVFPLIYLALAKYRGKLNWAQWKRAIIWMGMALCILLYGLYRQPISENWSGYIDSSITTTLFTMLSVFRSYIISFIYPINLSAYYHVTHQNSFFSLATSEGAIVLIGLLFGAWKLRNKAPLLSLSISLFLIGLIPYSQIFPLGALRADRYLFLSLPWFCLGTILILFPIFSSSSPWSIPTISKMILLGAFTVSMIIITMERIPVWSTSSGLWLDALKKGNKDFIVCLNLGEAYMEERNFDKALHWIKEAENYRPDDPLIEENLRILGKYLNPLPDPERPLISSKCSSPFPMVQDGSRPNMGKP